jgi:hypothetical protein
MDSGNYSPLQTDQRRRSSSSPFTLPEKRNSVGDQNANVIDGWAEDALQVLGKSCNVSELKDLRLNIRQLQCLQAGLATKKTALEELLDQVGINSPACQQSRLKLEKIGQVLPKRLSYLMEKSDHLVQIVEAVQDNLSWLKENQDRHSSVNNNTGDQITLRLAVSEKEYTVNKLMSQFQLLEREVVSSGLTVSPILAAEMAELKTKWFQLTAEARHVTSIVSSVPAMLTPSASASITVTAELPKTNSSHSVSSFVSAASLTSPTSQSSEQWAASPTTNTASASPMSEEVMPVVAGPDHQQQQLWSRAKRIGDWLGCLGKPVYGIKVADTPSVGEELDRLRAVLAQLDAKRAQKDELVKQLHEQGDQASGDLKIFFEEILSRWHTVHQELMARKTELTAMLEHSDNVTTKSREVAQWLTKLESTYADTAVGKTRDVLLRQIREVNQVPATNSLFLGVYTLDTTPLLYPGGMSADVSWRKKYEKGEENKGESVKEKGRKGKDK